MYKSYHLLSVAVIAAACLFGCFVCVQAQTTAFTYQGKLTDTSMPASAAYDFEFALYDTGGTIIGTAVQRNGTAVSNGVFTVSLDFGATAFPGADRLLEIRVKRIGEPGYTPLVPRQPITAAPYAIRSRSAITADNFTGPISGNGSALTNVVQVSSFLGGDIGPVPQTNGWVFLAGTTTVTIETGTKLATSGSATLSQNTVTTVPVLINLCHKNGSGSVISMGPNDQVVDVFNRRVTHTISYTGISLSPGTYQIGFCAINGTIDTLNSNGKVTGWAMLYK